MAAPLRHTKLGVKFVVLASALLVALGVSLTTFSVMRTRAVLSDALGQRGLALAQNLAANSVHGLQAADPIALEKIARPVIDDQDIAYVEIADLQGKVWVSKDPQQLAHHLSEAQARSELATGKTSLRPWSWNRMTRLGRWPALSLS